MREPRARNDILLDEIVDEDGATCLYTIGRCRVHGPEFVVRGVPASKVDKVGSLLDFLTPRSVTGGQTVKFNDLLMATEMKATDESAQIILETGLNLPPDTPLLELMPGVVVEGDDALWATADDAVLQGVWEAARAEEAESEAQMEAYRCAHPNAGEEEWRELAYDADNPGWQSLAGDEPPFHRVQAETFQDQVEELSPPLRVSHPGEDMTTKSIIRKWNMMEWFIVFKTGNKADCGVLDLARINIRDALANMDRSDWDEFLTREEKAVVRRQRWRKKLDFA